MEKLALKKALFEELKRTNERLVQIDKQPVRSLDVITEHDLLLEHKDFIQHLIDICVVRNKF